MKTVIKTMVLTVMLLIALLNTQAQSNVFFLGYVYTEDNNSGKQKMIPFATVKFYDKNDLSKPMATRISNMDGSYRIDDLDTKDSYVVKVSAPGIAEQSFMYVGSNKITKGNVSTHIHLITTKEYENPVKRQVYTPGIYPKEKNLTVFKMLQLIPVLTVQGNEIMSKEEGSVLLIINGVNREADTFNKVKDFPAKGTILSMDYYNLSAFDGAVYDGVLNLRFVGVKEVASPSFKCISLKSYVEN